jgi:hypothetical protein
MAETKTKQRTEGTFAQLYDVQQQINRRDARPLGRPPKKVQRKPTTVHLTKTEIRNLSKLHLLVNEQLPANRSELIGLAIDALQLLLEEKGKDKLNDAQPADLETFRQLVFDFIKS